MKLFNKFVNNLNKNTEINIKYKDESSFMKFLSFILFFVKFETFTTTIGNDIYLPNKKYVLDNDLDSVVLVGHEYVHVKDSKKIGSLIYKLMYLFPQILILLLPLAFININFIFLALCILPLPAYFRKNIEIRGYTATLMCCNLILEKQEFSLEDRKLKLLVLVHELNEQFTGAFYYFMWPFGVVKTLKENLDKILNDDILNDQTFAEVHLAMKDVLNIYEV